MLNRRPCSSSPDRKEGSELLAFRRPPWSPTQSPEPRGPEDEARAGGAGSTSQAHSVCGPRRRAGGETLLL